MLGCIISAITFKRFLKSPETKLNFFFACTILMGLVSMLLPYSTSFYSLVLLNLILWKLIEKLCKVIQNNVKSCYFQQLTTFGIQTLVGGLQETASQAFLVYTLGPVSRK